MYARLALEMLACYQSLFWKVDPQTGEKEYQAPRIKQVLGEALAAYLKGTNGEFDAAKFAEYLTSAPEAAEALSYLRQLGQIFHLAEIIGAVRPEVSGCKAILLRDVRPEGMTRPQLEAVINLVGASGPPPVAKSGAAPAISKVTEESTAGAGELVALENLSR